MKTIMQTKSLAVPQVFLHPLFAIPATLKFLFTGSGTFFDLQQHLTEVGLQGPMGQLTTFNGEKTL